MKELNLLIVEDDENALKSYNRDIKSFNIDSDIKIIPIECSDKDKALELLKGEKIFDAAIVDLDLLGKGGDDSSGNEVIREIKSNLRFPVFVITGTPQNVAEDLKEESTLFKIKTRGEQEDDTYLEQFINIYNTGVTNILNSKGTIEKFLNNIFWNHMSTSMDLWINDSSRDSEQKEKSLLRYTILHMLEYLEEENYHPSEFYITGPIKESIYTGDIVSYRDNRYIVLTPSCDIVLRHDGKRNTKKVLFCKIKDLSSEIKNFSLLTKETGKKNPNRLRFDKFITNNSRGNFHFIPKHNAIEAGLIDFQDKTTVGVRAVERKIKNGECKRLATVSMPFLKDIISRYSNYYSRQGSPDFNTDEIFKSLFG